MRLFPPPLEIADTEGFDPAKDIFGRAKQGQRLTNLIRHVSDPCVIAVDGQWGSGKTTFLRMWAGELRRTGIPVIYFDAFEHDYIEDAFTALAGELISLTAEKQRNNTPEAKVFVEKAFTASKVLARSGLKLGIKGATLGILDAADLKQIGADLATELSAIADKHLGERLTQQAQAKGELQAFREALSQLPSLLAGGGKDANYASRLVVIIDELDRCRPPFALDLLERIKHFYSVPGLHFVLGVHFQQLANSVVAAYGPNTQAELYLQKFIQLTLHLVEERRDRRSEGMENKFIGYLAKVMEFPQGSETLIRFLGWVAQERELSLRTIEKIMSVLAIAIASSSSQTYRPPVLLAGLCILKVTEPYLFIKAKRGKVPIQEVLTALALDKEAPEEADFNIERARDWWKFAINGEDTNDQFGRTLWEHNLTMADILPHIANHVIDAVIPVGS